jgi:hypothetical protein
MRLSVIMPLFLTLLLSYPVIYAQQQTSYAIEKKLPLDSSVFYFPFKPKPSYKDSSYAVVALDSFTNKWYPQMLFALQEPVLKNYTDKGEIYRFTWLRSFNHPIALTLYNVDDKIKLTVKFANGSGGFEPGQIMLNKTLDISRSDWEAFQAKVREANFWELPTDIAFAPAADGAEWILEGKTLDRYHFVYRFSCGGMQQDRFKECCEYLINMAKLSDEEVMGHNKY